MKTLFACLFLSFSISLPAQIKPERFFDEKISDLEKKQYESIQKAGLSATGFNYNITYHRFYWEINPAVRYIKGSVTTYFKPIISSLSEIDFDMHDTLLVDSIVYHGSLLSYSRLNHILTVSFPSAIPLDQPDSITVFYKGAPGNNGYGSFTQAEHNGAPVIWTLSEPYGARDWMPCKQSLNDKIDSIDIFIKTPSQYKAGTNGVLISEIITGPDKITHWKHRHPIVTYLIGIAVTNYTVYSDWVYYPNGDSLEILNYVYPESLSEAQQGTPITANLINLYSQYFIRYPFDDEKYGHTQCDLGGGMEHQTMTFLSSFGYELIAHELAHQWFGDFITCGNWHDIWINEGFATYVTGWSYEHFFNGYYWPYWKAQEIEYVTSLPDGSVYCADTTSVSRIFSGRLSYAKGAMLLHMIRWEIGDSAFFGGLHNYLTDSVYTDNFANTSDIINIFETAGDTSLTEFFNDWFYGEGYPVYTIQWSQDVGGNVSVTISQSQSHPSVSFFEMDVPVFFGGASADTIIRLKNIYSGEQYSFHLDFNVLDVVLDTEKWIVTRDPVIQYVSKISLDDEIMISPNPVKDILSIQSKQLLNIGKIEITDMLGKPVMALSPAETKKLYYLDLKSLATGSYFLKIKTDKTTIAKRFIRQ
ncbi:MAG: T9SS type A sorting domain-containing protein [Bacteroidia bacterium]|nr:T9SS type A sorting domain-containing protein [Bacteroidia bacterium]